MNWLFRTHSEPQILSWVRLMNAFVLKLLHFYPREKIVSIFYKLRELGNKEAKQMFFNCVFTSWISPCAVWANNSLKRTKFLLHSVLITISVLQGETLDIWFQIKSVPSNLLHLRAPHKHRSELNILVIWV